MNRRSILVMVMALCLLAGCGRRGSVENAQLRLKNTGDYSGTELRAAVSAIKTEFQENRAYAGGSLEMLYFDWFMSRMFAGELTRQEGVSGEVLVFSSDVLFPGSRRDGLTRQWLWYLTRDPDGSWRVIRQGRDDESGLEYVFY